MLNTSDLSVGNQFSCASLVLYCDGFYYKKYACYIPEWTIEANLQIFPLQYNVPWWSIVAQIYILQGLGFVREPTLA